MLGRSKILLLEINIVILLALLSGCAAFSGFSSENQFYDEDPVAREAMRARGWTGQVFTEEEERLQEERQYRQEQDIQSALESGNIVLGMSMDQVLSAWGRPRNIETAGDPGYGNQRWVYQDGLSGRWNINPSRTVYFEEGKVPGWETSH